MTTVPHTPGPWAIASQRYPDVIIGADDRRICSTFAPARHARECEANALLIAAAPELLRLLKQLRHDAGGWIEGRGDDEDALLDAVDAIVARVEGRA